MMVSCTGKGSTTSWSDIGNWAGGSVPTSYSDVSIGMASTSITLAVAAGTSAGSLTIGDGGARETVVLNLSGAFSVSGNLSVVGGATLTTAGGTLSDGGLMSVGSGARFTETSGVLSAVSFSNAGTSTLGGAVTISSGIINSGALTLTGSLVASSSIVNTGTMTLGGTVSESASIINSGSETLSGTICIGGFLTNNGTTTIDGTVGLGGGTILGTGSIDIDGGSLGTSSTLISVSGSQSFTIEDGGSLALRTGANASVTFGNGANTLYLGSYAGLISTPILDFGANDKIVVEEGDITKITTSLNLDGSYAVFLWSGNYYTPEILTEVTLASGIKASQISFKVSGSTTTLCIVCFLSGTRIETPDGEVAVETLAAGDVVTTIQGGQRVSRPVAWVGRRDVDLSGLDPLDARMAAPVRIRAGTFADAVPSRDLLVTPEHCILVDGGLVPARMLVNGSSIVQELSLERFTVHHVECDRHSILLSDGLTTESYLDTGNRGSFGLLRDDATRAPSCWTDAAAPLTTDRPTVEPIWQRLCARAATSGLVDTPVAVPTVADAQLRIRLQDGSRLRSVRRNGDRHFFVLPAGTGLVAIMSRICIPSLVQGPFVDDRRRMGVAVSEIRLWRSLQTETLVVDRTLPGWHAAEPSCGACWTDGAGELAFDMVCDPTMLEVTITMAERYLAESTTSACKAA